jgi:asparagine synthase (glutamine-hydrolysing)
VSDIAAHYTLSRQCLWLQAGLKPLIPQLLRCAWHWLHGRVQPQAPVWGRNRAIKPAFAQRVGLAKRMQASATTQKSLSAHHLREQHILGLMSGDMQYLMGMFDQTAAIFALEQRYPFFDRRLLEFCLALPFEHKLWRGWTRAILRRAMENVLPSAVQWRTDKGNLSINIRRRLLEERKTLEAVILHDPGIIEAYVDVPALRAAYRRYLAQPVPSTEEDLFTIYLAVSLALWLRQSEHFFARMPS